MTDLITVQDSKIQPSHDEPEHSNINIKHYVTNLITVQDSKIHPSHVKPDHSTAT